MVGAMQKAIKACVQQELIRNESFQGKDYLVVPVIALTEGVLWPSNAEAPELALAAEFNRVPQGWNGRPVTISHPQLEGIPVSANHPQVLEDFAIGTIFNAEALDKKLRLEAWLDVERMQTLGGDAAAIEERINSGEVIEVSTGLFATVEPVEGVYDGKPYKGVWSYIVPDHLAILPEGVVGACSVEGGCGMPRVNTNVQVTQGSDASDATTPPCNCSSKDNCTCQQGDQTQSQGQQNGAELTDQESRPSFIERMVKRALSLFSTQAANISDRDVRSLLQRTLENEGSYEAPWVIAVFDEFFVFEPDYTGKLYRMDYTLDESSFQVSFSGEPVEVATVTQFVPLDSTEATMTNNASNPDDTQAVNNQSADDASTDGANTTQAANSNDASQQADASADNAVTDAPVTNVSAGKEEPVSLEKFLSTAPTEVRDALEEAVRTHQERINTTIGKILELKSNSFTEDELRKMPLQTLEKLAKLGQTEADFSAQSGVPAPETRTQEAAVPPAPRIFGDDS